MFTTLLLAAAEEQPSLIALDIRSAVWVLVIFSGVAWILYNKAWKNVLAGLKAREERIRGDIARAEATRKEAEAMLAKYKAELSGAEQKVRDLIDQATVDAEKISTAIRLKAQSDAEEAKDRAMKEIATASEQAKREIYEQAAILATSIAEKILHRNINADDQRDLVAQSLSQLNTIGNN